MTGYSLFQPSILGMISQAHALGTISTNIANISSGGFKRTDTRFATVLSNNIRTSAGGVPGESFAKQERGLGGVKVKDFQTIDQQGQIISSTHDLDLAIAGDGFFQVSPTLAVSGQILYTRDGSFQINTAGTTIAAIADDGSTINVSQGFLTDKNGFFVLGVTPQANGTFSVSGALQPLRIDQFAFTNNFSQTLTADLSVNLPSNTKFGDPNEILSTTFIDSNGKRRAVTVNFIKTPTVNQWLMELTGEDLTNSTLAPGGPFSLTTGTGTGKILTIDPATRAISIKLQLLPAASSPGAFLGLRAGDSITVAGATGANNGTFTIAAISADGATITVDPAPPLGNPETVTGAATLNSTRVVGDRLIFDAKGQLTSPTSTTVNLTYSDGATNAFTLDISKMTQFNGAFTLFNVSQDGLGTSSLSRVSFDSAGHVIGNFEDGSSRRIYKIPLAAFGNPNGLESRNGNTFAESTSSGPARSVFADVSGIAVFQPNAVELSNVDLASQFTQMIQVQQAYNSSATVFRTVDEMTKVARDLKA